MRFFIVRLLLALVLTAPVVAAADDQDAAAFARYLARHRCTLVDAIERLHEWGDPANDMHRYFIVSMQNELYAQCHFYENDSLVLCEAYSGFYHLDAQGNRHHLAPAAIKALVQLGFNPDDSKGNFRIEFGVGRPPDCGKIATLVLKAMFVAFGAREATRLDITSPALSRSLQSTPCDLTG